MPYRPRSMNERKLAMLVNGTTYHDETSPEVIHALELARERHLRIRVHYGDTSTGRDWGDVYDVAGTVGRSTGPTHIPLLIANMRSTGGSALLDHCIVRIRHASRRAGGDIYRHPHYTPPPRKDHPSDWAQHFA